MRTKLDANGSDADAALKDFAAELTHAAYSVALRRGVGGGWLELQLDLWKVLNDTVEKWGRQTSRLPDPEGK